MQPHSTCTGHRPLLVLPSQQQASHSFSSFRCFRSEADTTQLHTACPGGFSGAFPTGCEVRSKQSLQGSGEGSALLQHPHKRFSLQFPVVGNFSPNPSHSQKVEVMGCKTSFQPPPLYHLISDTEVHTLPLIMQSCLLFYSSVFCSCYFIC